MMSGPSSSNTRRSLADTSESFSGSSSFHRLSQITPICVIRSGAWSHSTCPPIVSVSHLSSAGEGVTERESARNVDMTGGPIASGAEHGRDSLNGGSRVISSHEASKGLGDNASN